MNESKYLTIEFIEDNTGELTRQSLDEGYQAVESALGPEGVRALVEERNTAQGRIGYMEATLIGREAELGKCRELREKASDKAREYRDMLELTDRQYNALQAQLANETKCFRAAVDEGIQLKAELAEVNTLHSQCLKGNQSLAQFAEASARTGDCMNCGRRLPPDGDCWGCAADMAWAEIAELQAQLAVRESTISDLRELAYERQPKLAADELRKQSEEFEAQSAGAISAIKAHVALMGEANTRAHNLRAEIDSHRAHVKHLEATRDVYEKRTEKAEAQAAMLRGVLAKVATYLTSQYGPLYKLWEDGDICSWDDNPREFWKDVLDDLRNLKMATLNISMGVEWDAVTIYRAVQAALAPKENREGVKE